MDCIESYCALMLSEQEYIAIEPYLFELLTSREEQLGTQHPNLLPMLESLGQVYLAQVSAAISCVSIVLMSE